MKYLLVFNVAVVVSGYYYDSSNNWERKDFTEESSASMEVTIECSQNDLQGKIQEIKKERKEMLLEAASRKSGKHEITVSLVQVVPLE